MKLKNSVIKALIENGLQNTTDHSVDCKHAYKVYNFIHEVVGANKVLDEKRVELLKTAGIENAKEFDARRKALSETLKRTKKEQEELEAMDAKIKRFFELFAELMNDESELNVKTIPYEEFHKLAAENRATPAVRIIKGEPKTVNIDIFTAFRDDLKGILWSEPEEE